MQRVLEHSKVAQVLLLSFCALSVDVCAYPTWVLFSTPQEKRKMLLSLQLGQKTIAQTEGAPSTLAGFKNLLHL